MVNYTIMIIGKELALMAKKKGICEPWFDQMTEMKDKKALLDLYVKGIDFCLMNDYPSNDYIRKNFKGEMEEFGIHLDEELSLFNERKVVALGKCTGRIENCLYNVSEVFLKHNSELVVVAEGHSFVMIDIFDSAKLRIVASDHARVCINHYGGDIQQKISSGNTYIKVIEKHKKTY